MDTMTGKANIVKILLILIFLSYFVISWQPLGEFTIMTAVLSQCVMQALKLSALKKTKV